MNLGIKIQIESICRLTPHLECCGFVIMRYDGLHLMICQNISKNPEQEFEISSDDQIAAGRQGSILYVWHSHPRTGGFSEADINSANVSTLKQKLFNIEESKWYEYIPSTYRFAPFEGRQWSWGENDCFGIVRDYYLQKNISLTDFDRDENSNSLGKTVLSNVEKEGFVIAHKSMIKQHNILVFRTNGSPQHLAIFQGNSRVLHHPLEGLSRIQQINATWFSRLECVLKYKHPI